MSMKGQPDNWETHSTTFDDYGEACAVFKDYMADSTIAAVHIRHLEHPSKQAGFEIIFLRKEKEDSL